METRVNLPADFLDLFTEFEGASVRYLLIGGYAVGYHDRPRTTKDLDVWIDPDLCNVRRACEALTAFGASASIVQSFDRAGQDEIVWMGVPPLRIDLFKTVMGVEFDSAYLRSVVVDDDGVRIRIIGLDDLIAAKLAAGRDRDLLDAKHLQRAKIERERG